MDAPVLHLTLPAFNFQGNGADVDALRAAIADKVGRDPTQVHVFLPGKKEEDEPVREAYFTIDGLELSVPYIQYANRVLLESQRAIGVVSDAASDLSDRVKGLKKKIDESEKRQSDQTNRYEKMLSLSAELACKLKLLLMYYEKVTKCQQESLDSLGVIRKRLASLALDVLHISDPALSEPSDAAKRIRLATESFRGQDTKQTQSQPQPQAQHLEDSTPNTPEQIAGLRARLMAATQELEAMLGAP